MKIQYRPEVDGLRAVAVIAVILYHCQMFIDGNQFLQGGFLGVDVFFVISGFLITSLITKEYKTTGTFSFGHFYERRSRRLLPTLIVVALVSLIVAPSILFPYQVYELAISVLSALGFVANFYWHYELQQYEAASALIQPFLHTWSLAVEEQYYLIFPLLLLGLYKWLSRYVIIVLFTILLASLIYAEFASNHDPSFSFYMLVTRFWELLVGSILALYLFERNGKPFHHALNLTMPSVGALLIIYSFVYVGFDSVHPGLITVLPVMGTALIIAFANKRELVTKLLSTKLIVAIGLISYTLYIWHYPIFAFGRIVDPSPTWHDRVQWIALTIVFSALTYFIVEKPYRNRQKIGNKALVVSLLIGLFVTVGSSAYLINKNSKMLIDVDFQEEMKKRDDWQLHGYKVCKQITPSDCVDFAKSSTNKTVLIVGDSMGPDALRMVAKTFPEYNYVLSSRGFCIPAKAELRASRNNNLARCNALNKTRFNPDSLEGIDGVVVISINYGDDFVDTESELNSYFEFVKDNGIKSIILFGNYIHHSPRIYDLYAKTGGNQSEIESLVEVVNNDNDELLRSISENSGVDFISIRDIACESENKCGVYFDGHPYSWDNHHFSVEFTDYLSGSLDNILNKTWLAD